MNYHLALNANRLQDEVKLITFLAGWGMEQGKQAHR